MKTFLIAVSIFAVLGSAHAGDRATKAVTKNLDVETLNDQLASQNGKTVEVTGEVRDRIDRRSFVLESGGLFDDEIVVLTRDGSKGLKAFELKKDSKVEVKGVVRSAPIVEVRREMSWDLDPQLEVELQGASGFIIAESIKPAR